VTATASTEAPHASRSRLDRILNRALRETHEGTSSVPPSSRLGRARTRHGLIAHPAPAPVPNRSEPRRLPEPTERLSDTASALTQIVRAVS
jgi:hypothetical protein